MRIPIPAERDRLDEQIEALAMARRCQAGRPRGRRASHASRRDGSAALDRASSLPTHRSAPRGPRRLTSTRSRRLTATPSPAPDPCPGFAGSRTDGRTGSRARPPRSASAWHPCCRSSTGSTRRFAPAPPDTSRPTAATPARRDSSLKQGTTTLTYTRANRTVRSSRDRGSTASALEGGAPPCGAPAPAPAPGARAIPGRPCAARPGRAGGASARSRRPPTPDRTGTSRRARFAHDPELLRGAPYATSRTSGRAPRSAAGSPRRPQGTASRRGRLRRADRAPAPQPPRRRSATPGAAPSRNGRQPRAAQARASAGTRSAAGHALALRQPCCASPTRPRCRHASASAAPPDAAKLVVGACQHHDSGFDGVAARSRPAARQCPIVATGARPCRGKSHP